MRASHGFLGLLAALAVAGASTVADAREPAPPPMPRPSRQTFEVSFELSPGLSILRPAGQHWDYVIDRHSRRITYRGYALMRDYEPFCDGTEPCSLSLPPGDAELAVRKGSAHPIVFRAPIAGPSTVHVDYTDRGATRTLGAAVGVVGVVGGLVLGVEALRDDDSGGERLLLLSAVGVFLTGAILGTIWGTQHDTARVTVTPVTIPPPPESASREVGRGGALRVSF